MKLRDKFPELQNEAFVRQMMVDSVYENMLLEDQEVSRQKIEQMYDELQKDKKLLAGERKKFATD